MYKQTVRKTFFSTSYYQSENGYSYSDHNHQDRHRHIPYSFLGSHVETAKNSRKKISGLLYFCVTDESSPTLEDFTRAGGGG